MKKLVAALVVALLALSIPSLAFASTTSTDATGALKIALKDAGLKKSEVKKIETESKKKAVEVEFTQKKTRAEYDYTIAKNDGKILEKSVEYVYKHNSSKAKIAKNTALKKVAKASGVKYSVVKKAKCTYTYKKNEGKYEVVFRHKGYKYEYELLAPTGKIIELEMDYVGK